jgi:hypothetical protein
LAENAELIARLKAEALTQGFADIGITTADAIPEAGARLRQWLPQARCSQLPPPPRRAAKGRLRRLWCVPASAVCSARQAQVAAEVLGEGALVAEAEIEGNFGDGLVARAQ